MRGGWDIGSSSAQIHIVFRNRGGLNLFGEPDDDDRDDRYRDGVSPYAEYLIQTFLYREALSDRFFNRWNLSSIEVGPPIWQSTRR